MRTLLIMVPILMSFIGACKKEEDDKPLDTNVLSTQEQADLLFLVEEEKLARDVYAYAYAAHGLMVFSNINTSEQTHMDRISALLSTYGIANPTTNKAAGEFVNADLQALYNQLTAKVDLSLVDALTVGATIEDLDISDIDRLRGNTTKADLLSAYENLTCGSGNHMRAFVSQLKANNSDYTPQYLGKAAYEAILNAKHTPCGM